MSTPKDPKKPFAMNLPSSEDAINAINSGNTAMNVSGMPFINQVLKTDRVFHSTITNKEEFAKLLSVIGTLPQDSRPVIAKKMTTIVEANPRLLQDNKVFRSITQIIKNIPEKSKEFQELAGKIMIKLRQALVKNRKALNLVHKPMVEYSNTIREFLELIPAKPLESFYNSLEEDILNFIQGKLSKEQREKQKIERQARIAEENKNQSLLDDEDEDEAVAENKMQRLVKLMFSDVLRLEPDLVSAVIMSLITQLPHGNMIVEDKVTKKALMQYMDI